MPNFHSLKPPTSGTSISRKNGQLVVPDDPIIPFIEGDGKMAESLKTKPADLTDADWKHGSTDGEIYTVIHGGIKTAGMRAYSPKLTDHQIWDVVNYLRSIGPKKAG